MTNTQHRRMSGADRPETPQTAGPKPGDDPLIPARMRAATRYRYGPIKAVTIGEVDTPAPEPDEVLVEVRAAGVDRGVWHLLTGLPYLVRLTGFGLRRPRQPVLGMDVAGRVVAVGQNVTRLRVGEAVFGIGTGTFAEYARAHQDQVSAKPPEIPFSTAAAVAVSGLAAWQAVHEVAQVRDGQRLLLFGASGGVGGLAVQLATAAGAHVTAVASRAKLDLVADLGATHLIDYAATDPCDGAVRYDVIIDAGGRTPLAKLRKALTPDGTLVIVGGENGGRWTGGFGRQLRAIALSPWVGQRLTTIISAATPERLTQLGAALGSSLTPSVDRIYNLDDVPQALDDLVAGRIRGKAVIGIRELD